MTDRKRTELAIVLLALAGIVTAIAGAVMLFANPCFFRQVPPHGCPVAAMSPPGSGPAWAVLWLGAVAFLAAAGAAKSVSPKARQAAARSGHAGR